MELNNWNDVARLYDVVSREAKCDLYVPSWAKAYWKEMERIASAAYKFNFDTKFSIKAKVGPLIDLMVDRMRAKTMEDDPNPDVKLHVYVTHDWNMASFLMSLFRFNGIIPPPAATVTLELYRYFDTYTVRMLYFNSSTPELGVQEPNVLTIRGCAEYCPLAYVANYFHDYMPKDWYKVCGLKLKREEEDENESGRPFSLSDNKAKA
ncbi:prostatic acid phosphatase-like [Uloborus diversus]|uniref:prostatic acid phosphatase-like n=1 Tax=Uloborus diversus TaxID=327109 RepID=UPI00240999A1|nr:prostatic acid phosphatase-like [Uloborus diversus]